MLPRRKVVLFGFLLCTLAVSGLSRSAGARVTQVAPDCSHAPDQVDTVRYAENEVGLKLHVKAGTLAHPQVLLELANGKVRAFGMDQLPWPGAITWRGRVEGKGPLHYAFWLEPKGYRPGAEGLILDTSGVHVTSAPAWFTQELSPWKPKPAPDWVRASVLYQILPDRFEDGDRANDGSDSVSFGSDPSLTQHQGGDLKGIKNQLTYLNDLGVTALDLNPIVLSANATGFEALDFSKLDPHYGDADAFRQLVEGAHNLDMKVILATGLPLMSPAAPYPSLLAPSTAGAQFLGKPALSVLKSTEPMAQKYMLDAGAAWAQQGVDGWRLIAPLGGEQTGSALGFWSTYRQSATTQKRSPWMVAEGTDLQPDGDGISGVADLRWGESVLAYCLTKDFLPSTLDARLRALRENAAPAFADQAVLQLSSYATPRLQSELKGDPNRLSQAWVMLFAYPGVPELYYGDEVGMTGGGPPANQASMLWDQARQDRVTLTLVKLLVNLHRTRPSLYRGTFATVALDDAAHVFGFLRQDRLEFTLAIFNNGDESQTVNLPAARFGGIQPRDLIGGASFSMGNAIFSVTLPPHGVALLGT